MHVGLITYQTGHLKTFQLITKLLIKGFRITLFAFPFKPRDENQPIFRDRPYQIIDLDIEDFCRRQGFDYVKVGGWKAEHAPVLGQQGKSGAPDVYMTCIAKIIPQSFIVGRTILNCHPGLLPQNRGVDAFKNCVVNGWPFGITLHIIDEAIDRGIIVRRVRIPILSNDELKDVASRAYDMEVDLMADFDRHLGNTRYNWAVGDDFPLSRRRIPADVERKLEAIFAEKRSQFMNLATDPNAHSHAADGLPR